MNQVNLRKDKASGGLGAWHRLIKSRWLSKNAQYWQYFLNGVIDPTTSKQKKTKSWNNPGFKDLFDVPAIKSVDRNTKVAERRPSTKTAFEESEQFLLDLSFLRLYVLLFRGWTASLFLGWIEVAAKLSLKGKRNDFVYDQNFGKWDGIG